MSKSLGTLTLDLVARIAGFTQGMDKAARESAKWRKKVEDDMKAAGQYTRSGLALVSAAALGAAYSLASITKSGMDLIDSQSKLASSLNTSYNSLTALQIAARDGGLDGLEESLGTLNERLGAAELGSGKASIAVKALNLDLQALSQMDAAERVATIADAIQNSGISTQLAAKYLKDLGFAQNEATQFFAQGGDVIRAYIQRVEDLGLSLSDIDVAQVEAAGDAMAVFGDFARAASQHLAVALSPILQQVSQDLEAMIIEAGGFGPVVVDTVNTAINALAFVINAIDGVGVVFETVAKGIAVGFIRLQTYILGFADLIYSGPIRALNALAQAASGLSGIRVVVPKLAGGEALESRLKSLKGAIAAGHNDMRKGLQAPLAGTQMTKYFEKAKISALDAAAASVKHGKSLRLNGNIAQAAGGKAAKASGRAAKASRSATSAVDKTVEAIAREINALERAVKVWGMTSGEVKLYDLRLQGATVAQIAHAKSLIDTVEKLDKKKKAQESYTQLVKDLRTDEEELNDTLRERLDILKNVGTATDKDYSRAAEAAFTDAPDIGGLAPEDSGMFSELAKIDDAASQLESWYTTQLEMLAKFRAKGAYLNSQADEKDEALRADYNARQDAIENARQMAKLAAGEEFFGNLASVTKTFFGENSKLYKAAFAVEKAYAIAKALINVPKAYSDAYAATVGIPVIGPALAPIAGGVAAAAQVAQAAMIGNVNLSGQAHDGIDSVPETGTWLLEKGERVTTSETSAKLDATLDNIQRGNNSNSSASGNVIVNINEDASKAGQVKESQNNDQRVIDIFVANVMGDGQAASVIQNKFGLVARGR